jgi:hypothetical protein
VNNIKYFDKFVINDARGAREDRLEQNLQFNRSFLIWFL